MTIAVRSHNGVTKYLRTICLFIKNYTRCDYAYWHKGLPFKETLRTRGKERERDRERGGVILFNGTVSCKYYRTLMKDGCSMCMEHWWRFTGREKSKYI
jgi:hypothetical protein